MTLYTYRCNACGEVFETEDSQLEACPRCQSQDTQRKSFSATESSEKAGDYSSKFASSSFASRRRFI